MQVRRIRFAIVVSYLSMHHAREAASAPGYYDIVCKACPPPTFTFVLFGDGLF